MSLEFLEFNPNIFEFLPNLLLFMGSGIFGYLALTYLIDERTKKIFGAIIYELKNRNM
jgi:predicted ATP-grasp superfamily ATP-dependent carboligase